MEDLGGAMQWWRNKIISGNDRCCVNEGAASFCCTLLCSFAFDIGLDHSRAVAMVLSTNHPTRQQQPSNRTKGTSRVVADFRR